MNEQVSGCLPSIVVLGPSTLESAQVIEALENHPQLHGGKHSRTNFHENPQKNSISEYVRSFPIELGQEFTFFESSPSYLYSDSAPLSIRKAAPTSIFLVPLMNPVDHVISEYYSQTATLPQKCFSVPLEDYIQREIMILQQCGVPLNFPEVK